MGSVLLGLEVEFKSFFLQRAEAEMFLDEGVGCLLDVTGNCFVLSLHGIE